MIAIAESGSSKTDWIIASDSTNYKSFQTAGLHPLKVTQETVKKEMSAFSEHYHAFAQVTDLYFYGAGCGNLSRTALLRESLMQSFPQAKVHIQSDLFAACIASSGENPGICSILGTGSNSAVFDGHQIIENQISIGYLLGDEGSGSDLGKRLLRKVLYSELDMSLIENFFHTYHVTPEDLIRETYANSYPNKYFASFCPFLLKHADNPEINQLISGSFRNFINTHLLKYSSVHQLPAHFVGSIAYHFKDILVPILLEQNITAGTFLKNPIQGLLLHHLR
jgi:glucosamine kinase